MSEMNISDVAIALSTWHLKTVGQYSLGMAALSNCVSAPLSNPLSASLLKKSFWKKAFRREASRHTLCPGALASPLPKIGSCHGYSEHTGHSRPHAYRGYSSMEVHCSLPWLQSP